MMKRVNYYLSDVQLKKLDSESKKTGLSVSEILRRIIDNYFEKQKSKKGG